MVVLFNDDCIVCESKDDSFKFEYLNIGNKELYRLLGKLIENESDLKFELNSEKLIAKKFYDILKIEFIKDNIGY